VQRLGISPYARHLLGAASLILVLGFQALKPAHAWAAISSCRADPRVHLTDGTIVTLTTLIGVPADQVQALHYVLHIPMGARAISVTYPGGRRPGETVKIISDDAMNAYDSTTVTVTGMSKAAVTAAMTVNGTLDLTNSSSGLSGQVLPIHLTVKNRGRG
jgi:hypothetical protein